MYFIYRRSVVDNLVQLLPRLCCPFITEPSSARLRNGNESQRGARGVITATRARHPIWSDSGLESLQAWDPTRERLGAFFIVIISHPLIINQTP
jgi:hypothetical protein